MGVVSNSWFDSVLFPILYMFRHSCRPMLKPDPFVPLVPLSQGGLMLNIMSKCGRNEVQMGQNDVDNDVENDVEMTSVGVGGWPGSFPGGAKNNNKAT